MHTFVLLVTLTSSLLVACAHAGFTRFDALLIIDVQNDFMEETPIRSTRPEYPIPEEAMTREKTHIKGGSLGVLGSTGIIDIINDWSRAFADDGAQLMASLDWHAPNHCSFCRNGTAASNPTHHHPHGSVCGPFGASTESMDATGRCTDTLSTYDFERNSLMQWPDHCLAGTFGARFHPYLRLNSHTKVFKKGIHTHLDAYSSFDGHLALGRHPFDVNDAPTHHLASRPTLPVVVTELRIRRLFVVGIATDYCVFQSVIDALRKNPAKSSSSSSSSSPSSLAPEGLEVYVVAPAVRGVSPTTSADAWTRMSELGAHIVTSPNPREFESENHVDL